MCGNLHITRVSFIWLIYVYITNITDMLIVFCFVQFDDIYNIPTVLDAPVIGCIL